MKKRVTICTALVLLVVAGIVVHVGTLDGIDGLVLRRVFGEDTVYAPGYTDRLFRKVAVGMTVANVKGLLGEPLSSNPTHEGREYGTFWCYSESPSMNSFRSRAVKMRNGVVVGSYAEFTVY
jgi:hypothetical protein